MEMDPKTFTGTCYTLVYRPHEGFADYAVAEMTLEKGVVKKIKLSDPYAAFEASAHMELANSRLLEKLRKGYPSDFRHV